MFKKLNHWYDSMLEPWRFLIAMGLVGTMSTLIQFQPTQWYGVGLMGILMIWATSRIW